MSLRDKSLIIIGFTIVVVIALIYAISQIILLGSYARLENQLVSRRMIRAVQSLESRLQLMQVLADEWANRDIEEYRANLATPEGRDGLVDALLRNHHFQMAAVLDANGNVLFNQVLEREASGDQAQSQRVNESHSWYRNIVTRSEGYGSDQGLLMLQGKPAMVIVRSLPDEEAGESSRGRLILGRYLDEDELTLISAQAGDTIQLYPISNLPAELEDVPEVIEDNTQFMISPISDQMIAGSAVLTDLNGEEVLLLRTEMQREIYQQGRDSLSYFIFLLFSVAAIFCLIVVMLLERQILSPLAFLSQRVISIGHSGTLSERIGMTGNDEVAALAYEIDDMLDQLQQASKALTESEEKFRKLAESSVACIFILQSGHFRYVNPIAVAIFGYSREQFTQMEYQKLFMKDDRTLVQDFIHEVEMGREYAARFELRALTSNGAVRWLEITASPIEYEGERAVIGTAYDLTEHKLAEEQLRYLSNHDALSGLYNRTYFEEELNRLESGRVHPISIVIIDIDGLKPTNDTCGHAAGDELIRQTAKVLRKVFRAEDVVARIGGDEFAVLLPGVDEEEVLQVQKRIQETLVTTNEERQSGPRLQFSVGVATAKQPSSLEAVMRKADEHMYRVKLKRKQQAVDPSNCPDLDELDIRDSRRQ